MGKIRRLLFRIARSRVGGWIVGWVFTYMSFIIPVERLRETRTLIAFYHPKPGYAVHILIVPKRAIRQLSEVSVEDQDFLVEVFQTVQSLVAELNLASAGYRLIVNGGAYQDVPHLHFHLVADQRNSD